jgi:replication factor A1
MRNKASPSEYLALLSVKYEVDAEEFFNALVTAGKSHVSSCGVLTIECRDTRKDKIILLITKGTKVVAQFPLPIEYLLDENNPIEHARKASMFTRYSVKKERGFPLFQIKDLQIGMRNVSLKAEVQEIGEKTLVITRFGNYATVANALISDGTGKIKLCLWNEQINSISVGDNVEIENASVSTFKGERQMRIGKKGILRTAKDIVAS